MIFEKKNKKTIKNIKLRGTALITGALISSASLSGCTFKIHDSEGKTVSVEVDDKDVYIDTPFSDLVTTEPSVTTQPILTTEAISTTMSWVTCTKPIETTLTSTSVTSTAPILTTTTTTTTTPTTTPIEESIDVSKLSYDGFCYSKPVIEDCFMCTVTPKGGNFNTIWQMAVAFHPANISAKDFVSEIYKANNMTESTVYFPGDKLKIPAVTIKAKNGLDAEGALASGITTLDNINKFNNTNYTDSEELSKNKNEIVINALPIGTSVFDLPYDKQNKAYIYKGALIIANSFNPCKSLTNGKDAFVFSFVTEEYHNYFSYVELDSSNDYVVPYMGNNVSEIYVKDGIPVFVCRNDVTTLSYSTLTGESIDDLSTLVSTQNANYYKFYEDTKGNICFTFSCYDLTKYGFKVSDKANQYVQSLKQKSYQKVR